MALTAGAVTGVALTAGAVTAGAVTGVAVTGVRGVTVTKDIGSEVVENGTRVVHGAVVELATLQGIGLHSNSQRTNGRSSSGCSREAGKVVYGRCEGF